MPHKHKRKRGKDDDNDFDLPPSQRAQPLLPSSSKGAVQPQAQKKRKKSQQSDSDAPRGFRRMMAYAQGKKTRSGLDDGLAPKSKVQNAETQADSLRIRPGEGMGAFSSRVNAALPVSGLTKKTIVKDGRDEQGVKVWRTRKEKNMHKLYDQWRAEERKIQERREEEAEEEAEREMENDAAGISAAYAEFEARSGKKKKKRRGKDDDDPWAALKKKRAEAKTGLHDVAQAPPQLHKSTTRALKVKGDATVDVENIPKTAGSLRRREELQQTREEVLDAYRKIKEYEQAKLNGLQ